VISDAIYNDFTVVISKYYVYNNVVFIITMLYLTTSYLVSNNYLRSNTEMHKISFKLYN